MTEKIRKKAVHMKVDIKSYEHAMKVYMKKMKSHMKRYKDSYD